MAAEMVAAEMVAAEMAVATRGHCWPVLDQHLRGAGQIPDSARFLC